MFDFLDADALHVIALVYWFTLVFALGIAIGSFVNVAVARLPFEKSLLWPGSRCGSCHQPVRWYDNVPLVSYLWLRGRCRTCGQRFSSRYFWIELATGLLFVGLFYCEAVINVHGWPGRFFAMPPWPWLAGFAFHATLMTLLLSASICDLRTREIPLGLTMTGTVIGLVGAVLMPWPWPWTVGVAPAPLAAAWQNGAIKQGIYAWPFWGPLPEPFAPGGNWQTGLATGIAGALAGTFLMRAVGFLATTGLGKDAMGLGDADLMMMAGAFLGWQVVMVAFLLSVVPALVIGVVQLAVRQDSALAFGPSLAIGVMAASLCWQWIGPDPRLQPILFNWLVMVLLLGASAGLLLGLSFVMRVVKGERMGTILIVDYGMANLRSVQKAFERVGAAADISGDPQRIGEADKVVLPGVGAFRDAIARLHEAHLADPIKAHIRAGKPFLGICLGLQLLFTRSHEDGVYEGLDVFPGEVVRFDETPGLKIPHMGWNQLRVVRRAPCLCDLPPEASVYFVHSYYVRPTDAKLVATETDYPTPFASSIWHENVFATQFHPEKSQQVGLGMLRQFANA